MDEKVVFERLAKPFSFCEIEWKAIQEVSSKGPGIRGIVAPYLKNRAIMRRLDEVVGCMNWKPEYREWLKVDNKPTQLCGLSIYYEDRKEWITKWDGSDMSRYEPIKGGLSDSMKRAAVQWSIGRYLYEFDTIYATCTKRGDALVICKEEYPKLSKAYAEMVLKVCHEGAPSSPDPSLPGAEETDVPPAGTNFVVRSMEEKSNFYRLGIWDYTKRSEIVALAPKAGNAGMLAQGLCLKSVTITEHSPENNKPGYYTLDHYIAA